MFCNTRYLRQLFIGFDGSQKKKTIYRKFVAINRFFLRDNREIFLLLDNKMPDLKVNEDLVRERKKCTFDISELTHLIDGGEQNTLERKEIGKYYRCYLLEVTASVA